MSNAKEPTQSSVVDTANTEPIRPLSEFPDLSSFTIQQSYPALIAPVKQIAGLRKTLSKVLLRLPRLKNVYPAESDTERILVLADKEALSDTLVQESLHGGCRVTEYKVELSYDYMTTDDILKKILPVDEVPSSFEAVGHLAHLNLRDDCLPYKYWIGKVILDKNQPRVRTVVNKLGSIENEFRTFGMEVIAGDNSEGWSLVTVKEEGCVFTLDFREVYWNSRLAGEHKRLVDMIHKEARSMREPLVVADLMAGVGPFAVPLTAHKNHNVVVYANDLNPSSYKYLKINSEKNKCKDLHCYNEDGRAFAHRLSREGIKANHVIMNLPAIAPEFLDAFRGYSPNVTTLPRIHVHCFAPKDSESTNYQCAVDRCGNALGYPLDRKADMVHIRVVRDVSPKKNMICVSFQLPEVVCALPAITLIDRQQKPPTDDEPEAKRQKSDGL